MNALPDGAHGHHHGDGLGFPVGAGDGQRRGVGAGGQARGVRGDRDAEGSVGRRGARGGRHLQPACAGLKREIERAAAVIGDARRLGCRGGSAHEGEGERVRPHGQFGRLGGRNREGDVHLEGRRAGQRRGDRDGALVGARSELRGVGGNFQGRGHEAGGDRRGKPGGAGDDGKWDARHAGGQPDVLRGREGPAGLGGEIQAGGGKLERGGRNQHHAYAVVYPVGNVQVAGGVHRHGRRIGQPGTRGSAAVAGIGAVVGIAAAAAAGDGIDDAAGGDPADALVVGIGDIEIAGEIAGQPLRAVQQSSRGRQAVAAEAGCSPARHGLDGTFGVQLEDAVVTRVRDVYAAVGGHCHAGRPGKGHVAHGSARQGGDDALGIDLADRVVAIVGDVQAARRVHRDRVGELDGGGGGDPSVAGVVRVAVAGHGGDDAFGGDFADAAVEPVGDVQVAGLVRGQPGGVEEARAHGRITVAGVPFAAAGHRGDDAAAVHLAHALAPFFGDEEIALGVEGDAGGQIERGAGGRSALAGIAVQAVSGHGGDSAPGIHAADAAVAGIGDVEVAVRVEGEPGGLVHGGLGSGAAVAGKAGRLIEGAGHQHGTTGHQLEHDVEH